MTLLFPALWVSLIVLAANFLNAQLGPEIMGVATPVLMLVPAVFSIYFSVRRYVNLGMSGWWIFGNLVPLLNLWLGYRCFACPAGYAFQKKLDGPGIFLAIVYWLLVAIAVVSLGLMIALLMGSVGSPELQERFREILSKSMGPKP